MSDSDNMGNNLICMSAINNVIEQSKNSIEECKNNIGKCINNIKQLDIKQSSNEIDKCLNDIEHYRNAQQLSIKGKYVVYVLSCYDGDTFTGSLKYNTPNGCIYLKFNMRAYGYDAYELKVSHKYNNKKVMNITEMQMKGKKSKKELESLILHKFITIDAKDFDKYGRVLSEVIEIENKAFALSEHMIKNKFGFPYNGEGEKPQYNEYVLENN